MKLIVGLGNPGNTYTSTRHNVGFMMVESLRHTLGWSEWQDSRFSGVTSEAVYKWEKIVLLKPTTYMNLSWDAVLSIVSYYKLEPQTDILIISDDIDMDFAKVRFRLTGSHGGQNGLRDIITKLSTSDFARIKIGIGRHEKMGVSDWVLSKFSPSETDILRDEVVPLISEKILHWLS